MTRIKTGPNKAEAKTIRTIMGEYPSITSITFENDVWNVMVGEAPVSSADLDEAIAKALELQVEPEQEEQVDRKTIVPVKYRNEYRARGHADRCGDSLSNHLKEILTTADGNVDLVALYQLLEENGITKRWDHLNPGQQRMCGGNMLRNRLKANGGDLREIGGNVTIIT